MGSESTGCGRFTQWRRDLANWIRLSRILDFDKYCRLCMIQLVRANANQPVMSIAHNIPAINGVREWTIPVSTAPASDYKIKIALVSNAGTMTFNLSDGFFTIINGNPNPLTNSITVLSPNGGEVWIAGAPAAITWTHQNLTGNVRISLVRPNMSAVIVLAPSIPIDSGSITWVVPQHINPSDDYRVHVVWLSMLTVYVADLSDNSFSIVNDDPPPQPPPAYLTLTSPNGGEVWTKGTTNSINWTTLDLGGSVRIILVRNPGSNNRFLSSPATHPTPDPLIGRSPCASPKGIIIGSLSLALPID